MIIDLANLQAWQVLVGLLGVLGLSPAPWLLGMAFNRIQFTKPAEAIYNARIADLKTANAAAITALVEHHGRELKAKDDRYDEVKVQRDEFAAANTKTREAYSKLAGEFVDVVREVSALAGTTLGAVSDTPQDRGTK